MIETGKIKLEFEGGFSLLHCPRCGSRNLHHMGVTVFDRHEDAMQLTKTHVSDGTSSMAVVQSQNSGNPSLRRNGLSVQFSCEGCNLDGKDTIELTLAQHKGDTWIAWRFCEDALAASQPREQPKG